jgi:ribosome biogenesis GTPase
VAKKKVRVEFRKNRAKPPRDNDLTRTYREDETAAADVRTEERVRAKGDLSRHRTVVETDDDPNALGRLRGRVLRVHGLNSYVETEDGRLFTCAIRRVLKTRATEERGAVTTGDRVWIRPSSFVRGPSSEPDRSEPRTKDEGPRILEGLIEKVEPRRSVLTRTSRRREHVLVANVDQVVIVVSLVEPDLKPHLIDRYVAAAEKGGLAPIICLNKIDLADPAALQPMIGAYARFGIPTVLTSARTGAGVEHLRRLLHGRATVFSGQSGVGKSSLLNAVQPGLGLRVREVSDRTQKGQHTTTTAELLKLDFGGWVVDTPGVRQFQLYGTRPEEMEGLFREFRPFVPGCPFPDCTHIHEAGCAIQAAVARHQISDRRYQSYLGLFHDAGQD